MKIAFQELEPRQARVAAASRAADELRSLAEPLITSGAVQRLGGISFLGVLSRRYTRGLEDAPNEGSRLDHSIGVAELALQVSKQLQLGALAERYSVAWGLVHDIATWPLSHTSEPAFVNVTGVSGKVLRERIVLGHASLPRQLWLGSALREMGVEPRILLSLFERHPPNHLPLRMLWQVTHSPLTPDTLEGIRRAGIAFGSAVPSPHLILRGIARSLFDVTFRRSAWRSIRSFWVAKSKVYSHHINTRVAVRQESQWARAIEIAFPRTTLGKSMELIEEHILERVRQFELPQIEFAFRYKPPLAYMVNSESIPQDNQDIPIEHLPIYLQKRPLAKLP